jgi:Zn-dependent protease with chaperone function
VNAPPATPPDAAARESFFAAQARYRASARRWSVLMALAVFAVTLLISLLLAPVAFALIGLLADLVNLVVPAPDLLRSFGGTIDAIVNSKSPVPIARLIELALVAALPGFIALVAIWRRLGRIAVEHDFDALRAALGLREPRAGDLEEHQLANVVEEMAIAAERGAPGLVLLDSAGCNLGIFGEGDRAAIVVTRGLVDRLDRAQTEALIGQATAALGNGDGLLAERMLRLDLMIGLLMLIAQAPMEKSAREALRPLVRIRRADEGAELASLRSVLGGAPESSRGDDEAASGTARSWRDWAIMPLMGSMLIGILIVPISVMLLVAPLHGLIWRRRRLLADAMAVQFTRDPEALAEAYRALAGQRTELDLKARSLGNLFVLDTGAASNLGLGSPYPRLETRIARLDAMGAHVALPAKTRVPVWVWAALSPIAAVMVAMLGAVVVLGTWLSLAINGLFLAVPTALIHVALRAIGHS